MWSTIQKEKAALVWGATGCGKTIIFTKFIEQCKNFMEKKDLSFNAMVLVHKIDLVEQTVDKLKASTDVKDFGIFCGSLNEANLGKQVTVASIQSVYKRPAHLLPKINLLIVDEAHRYHRTKMYQALRYSLLINNPKMKVIYFTATPYDTKKAALSSVKTQITLELISLAIGFGWMRWLSKATFVTLPFKNHPISLMSLILK